MLTQEQINSAHAQGFNYFEQEIEKLTNMPVNEDSIPTDKRETTYNRICK